MKAGKNILIWLIAFLFLTTLLNSISPDLKNGPTEKIAFSEFMNNAENNRSKDQNTWK